MAATIFKIKRALTGGNAVPASGAVAQGELAYAYQGGTLFIGGEDGLTAVPLTSAADRAKLASIVNPLANVTTVAGRTGDVVLTTADLADFDTVFDAKFDTDFAAKTTDDLTEGATNKYFTSAGFDTLFEAKNIDDLNDVVITAPAAGQLLTFNAGNSTWVNTDAPITGVASVAGTANQITASTTAGAVTLSLAAPVVGATATFQKVTVDALGRVTNVGAVVAGDITTTLGFTPVNVAGDTMTGTLVLAADPVNPLEAATKSYVDAAVTAGLPDTGTPVTAAFVKVTTDSKGRVSATTPVVTADLTTLLTGQYVDLTTAQTVAGAKTFTSPVVLSGPTTNLTVGGNVTVTGNMTVNGTLTAINSTEVDIADSIIRLQANATGPALDSGIEVFRGGGANATPSMIWSESAGLWGHASNGTGFVAFADVGASVTSVVGTANRITVDSTSSVAPIIDIAATYVGQASITTLGTVTTGTWNGTTVDVAHGGTGAVTLTGYVKGNGTGAFTASATIPGADVTGNIAGNAANVTGVVAIANGGTGAATKAAGFDALSPMSAPGDLIVGGTAGTGTALAVGTTGQVLTSDGTTAAWATPVTGITTFIGLTDTPNDYTTVTAGAPGHLVGINSAGTALAYFDVIDGGTF